MEWVKTLARAVRLAFYHAYGEIVAHARAHTQHTHTHTHTHTRTQGKHKPTHTHTHTRSDNIVKIQRSDSFLPDNIVNFNTHQSSLLVFIHHTHIFIHPQPQHTLIYTDHCRGGHFRYF